MYRSTEENTIKTRNKEANTFRLRTPRMCGHMEIRQLKFAASFGRLALGWGLGVGVRGYARERRIPLIKSLAETWRQVIRHLVRESESQIRESGRRGREREKRKSDKRIGREKEKNASRIRDPSFQIRHVQNDGERRDQPGHAVLVTAGRSQARQAGTGY